MSACLERGLQVTQVEAHVVCNEDRISEEGEEVFRQFGKRGRIGHHAVIDARQTGNTGRNGGFRVDEMNPPIDFPHTIVQDGCDFRDVRTIRGTAIGLDVHDGELERGLCHASKDMHGYAVDVRC